MKHPEDGFLEEGKDLEVKDLEDRELPAPFDPLKRYLAEVSKHPVLTREQEIDLAVKAFVHKDRDAAQMLVISNLKLVVKIALEYYNTYLNILDLIQEGNVGLVHAVKKYNPYKGTRFSTYASFWIRAYILKHIMDSWSMVKVGTTQSQRKLFYRLNKEKKRLEAQGVVPAPQLLASTLDVKAEEVEDMEKRLAYTDMSLDHPLYDEGEETLMDVMQSDENIEDAVTAREKRNILEMKVKEFKTMLNDKELLIFEKRIMAEEPMTLQEIGARFKISRERVRQIENRVLKKFNETFQADLRSLDL
ncbi:MAG TPA: RNA polymerase factor sigma-32 [Syntrophorhabdales bacterium]|nr:RNA polymerase factor sigma-32 [Syntrophorhabdales bacterium]